MVMFTFIRSACFISLLSGLIGVLKATKDTNSGSSHDRVPSTASLKSASTGSSDVRMTKLQLGYLPETGKGVGTSTQPKSKKRKDMSASSDQSKKQLRFDPLHSPYKGGDNKLLQLIEEMPGIGKAQRQSIIVKEELLGRISKARKFPLHPVKTNDWDREKLKRKLLDTERVKRRPLAQLRGSKTQSSTTGLIQLGSDTGSSHSKHTDLDTNLSLSRSNTFSSPQTFTSPRASSAVNPSSSSGSIDTGARPRTY
ncbi:uncharacterized protein FA14DRAFT_183896 [Meira miltonrushii]|uniref:Uncharacterized protein n=1 Tax=Meira miltonrushii TaxID=1280837 RepID=A0A316VN93_9BASI|nr:uncharacterized protein FA14DRAFT_183896 [Meira miltonrushii]PWN38538.1 hypothetical protein FA14DRAFT_183896 [Meira miltonrushii]